MMRLILHLTQNLGFPCFSHPSSLFLHAFSLLQDLWWFLFVSPQLFVGWSFLCSLPCPSELSLPQTYVSFHADDFQTSVTLPPFIRMGISIFPGELFVANLSSAGLKETLMFSLHQGGSTFPDCFSLSPASYLLLSLHPQVFLSCRV